MSRRARSETIDRVLAAAETALSVASEGVRGVDVPGLEGAIGGVLAMVHVVQSTRDNSPACEDVATEIESLGRILQSFVTSIHKQADQEAAGRREFLKRLGAENGLIERIAHLQQNMNEILQSAEKLQKISCIKALLYAKRNVQTLQKMNKQLIQARDDFTMKGQVTIELILHKIVGDMAANHAAREATQAAQEEDHVKAELDKELARLPFADASFRASVHARHGSLLPGTRVEILRNLDEWAGMSPASDEREAMPFFLLSGSAGTGKSTIAFEVAKRARRAGLLGATFFFMRGAHDLSTTELVFPTLARQLISHIPALQTDAPRIIRQHLRHDRRQNLEEQANGLFTPLLSSLPADHPPVIIIIDAIDECTEAAQDLVPRMLYLMMEALPLIACRLRIFITTRPDLRIEEALQSITFTSHSQRFQLHEVPRPTINADIKLYFEDAVRKLPETSRRILSVLYPSVEEELTDLAAGLFIFATTAMEYLNGFRHADVPAAMEMLMGPIRKGSERDRGTFARLNSLYDAVLSTAFTEKFLSLPGRLEHVRAILGCIAVLQDHVSPRTLSALISMDFDSELRPVLELLAAVASFDLNDPNVLIRPLHASFAEFLVDPSRCADERFQINSAVQHGVFAEHCFVLLSRQFVLARNIVQLPDPAVMFVDVPDRHDRIATTLPSHVQYACTYWPAHVALGPLNLRALRGFCQTRLLYWLEALSLLDRLYVVVTWFPAITNVRAAEWDTDEGKPIEEMLQDVYRLTVECAPALAACPEQLYRSVLALCPSSSRLRKVYEDVVHESCALRLVTGQLPQWPTWLRMLPTPPSGAKFNGITHVIYAPHGRWIALCTNVGVLHLCSPDDGAIIKSLRAYSDERPLQTVLISENGLRILTLDMKGEVRILSTRSGAIQHSLPYSAKPGPSNSQPHGVAWGIGDREVLVLRLTDLLIWNLAQGTTDVLECLPRSASPTQFTSLCSSGGGRWACLLSRDHTLSIFDVSNRTRVFHTHLFVSWGICVVPHSSVVVYEDLQGLVWYDPASDQITRQLPLRNHNCRSRPRISGDGSIIAYTVMSDSDQDPRAEVVFSKDAYSSASALGPCVTFDISPDGRHLLVVVPGSLEWKVYDVSRPERLTDTQSTVRPHEDVLTLAISPDARFLAALAYRNLNILDTSTGEVAFELPFSVADEDSSDDDRCWGFMVFEGRSDPPSDLPEPACTPTELDGPIHVCLSHSHGTLTIAISYGALLQVHTLETSASPPCTVSPSRIAALPLSLVDDDPDKASVLAAAFSADGSTLVATGTLSSSRYIFVWDVATLALRHTCAVSSDSSDDLPVHAARRVFLSDDLHIHWENWATDDPHDAKATFSVTLSDVLSQDDVVLTRTSGMPDEKFSLSKDGWIARVETGQRLLWLPPSRWPKEELENSTGTTSALCGDIIATVSPDNLLSIVDMSTYE